MGDRSAASCRYLACGQRPAGPEVHVRIWRAMCEIPYGATETYGQLARRSGLDRSEVFVTSKLNNNKHARDDALKAFDQTLDDLGRSDLVETAQLGVSELVTNSLLHGALGAVDGCEPPRRWRSSRGRPGPATTSHPAPECC